MHKITAGILVALVALWSAQALAYADRVGHGDVAVGESERVGDAVAMGGSLTVRGWVTGDAVALGGGVHLLPGARVDGDITALGGSVVVDQGAAALGSQTGIQGDDVSVVGGNGHGHDSGAGRIDSAPERAGPASFVENWLNGATQSFQSLVQKIGHMLALFGLIAVLGLIMLGVAPLRTRALAAAVAAHPAKSFGLGLLVVIVSIAAIILLAVTVIGLPIAAVLAVAIGCGAALGLTGVSILIGELLPFKKLRDRQFLKLLLGTGLLVLALGLPYVGGILGVFATLLGLGSLTLTRLRPGHQVFAGQGPYRTAPTP